MIKNNNNNINITYDFCEKKWKKGKKLTSIYI